MKELIDNTFKLDKKDRKILFYLSQDCRQSNKQIARNVALSENAVKYRIDRLKQAEIISKFTTVLNLGKLGYNTSVILLKLNEDIYSNKLIKERIIQNRYVNWAVTLSGRWDLLIEIVFLDIRNLQDIIEAINTELEGLIDDYKAFISIPIKVDHLIKEIYADLGLITKDTSKLRINSRNLNVFQLDHKDKNILRVLSNNAKTSFLEIGKATKLSMDIVRYRIKKLQENEILKKCFSEINLKKLGYTEYIFKLELKVIRKEILDNLFIRLGQNINITYAFYDFTSQNIICNCAFKDSDSMDKLSREIRNEFRSIINDEEILIIKEQLVFNLFPSGLAYSNLK